MLKIIKAALLCILAISIFAGCSSKPEQTPEAFIKEFMVKHVKMLDAQIADFYTDTEKALVKGQVDASVAAKEAEGALDFFKAAQVDLSNLKIEVMGQKDASANDQAYTYLKVHVTGKYSLSAGEKIVEVDEDETIIIKAEGRSWKVTEKENPWS